MLPCLLDQFVLDESIASVRDDGAYGTKGSHEAIVHRGAAAIISTCKMLNFGKTSSAGA